MDGLLGYITFYLRVENENEVAYGTVGHDFRKLPTEDYIIGILESVKGIYEETGMRVDSITFCTKEEYEADIQSKLIEHEWHEE